MICFIFIFIFIFIFFFFLFSPLISLDLIHISFHFPGHSVSFFPNSSHKTKIYLPSPSSFSPSCSPSPPSFVPPPSLSQYFARHPHGGYIAFTNNPLPSLLTPPPPPPSSSSSSTSSSSPPLKRRWERSAYDMGEPLFKADWIDDYDPEWTGGREIEDEEKFINLLEEKDGDYHQMRCRMNLETRRLKRGIRARRRVNFVIPHESIRLGFEVRGDYYPLVFYDAPSPSYRSLPFLSLIGKFPGILQELEGCDRRVVGLGVRDLFLAHEMNMLSKEEDKLLFLLVERMEEFEVARKGKCCLVLGEGGNFVRKRDKEKENEEREMMEDVKEEEKEEERLTLCYFPTKFYSAKRFFPSSLFPEDSKVPFFAKENNDHRIAFVNPQQFTNSFFNKKKHLLSLPAPSLPLPSLPSSFDFLSKIVSEEGVWEGLGEDQKRGVGIEIRDLFFRCEGREEENDEQKRERELLLGVCRVVEYCFVVVEGVEVSFFPTKTKKMKRFLDPSLSTSSFRPPPLGTSLPSSPSSPSSSSDLSSFFQKKMCDLVAFVDPESLSYHNFENILPLDTFFQRSLPPPPSSHSPSPFSSLKFTNPQQYSKPGIFTFSLSTPPSVLSLLLSLNDSSLFTPVLNQESRGGSRFVFHSTLLSDALTTAFQTSLSPSFSSNFKNFQCFNSVFRFNRFIPSDLKFRSHLDSPFYDPVNSHISKYTFLLYLTGNKKEKEKEIEKEEKRKEEKGGEEEKFCLRIEEVNFKSIEAMTCVIFDQKYEHEGCPFLEVIFLFHLLLLFKYSLFLTRKNRERNFLFALSSSLKKKISSTSPNLVQFSKRFLETNNHNNNKTHMKTISPSFYFPFSLGRLCHWPVSFQ